jgi:glycosyltransferase involved in cell wall biosynthesis
MERPSGVWILGRVRSSRPGAAEATPLQPHEPMAGRPRLSVIVPAYGEGRRIGATVATLRRCLAGSGEPGEVEVVVVDDGSPDDTADQARRAGADQVIRLSANRGKGAAVRAGMLAATGSAVVFTDADLSYSPAQVLRVRDGIEVGWDAVVGSRVHPEASPLVPAGLVRQVSGRVFNLFTRLVLRGTFGDTQCGLKGFHRDTAQKLFGLARIDGFAFDVEILWLCQRFDVPVLEVPVELASGEGSTVRLPAEAVNMIRDLLRIRRLARTGGYDWPGAAPREDATGAAPTSE